MVKQDFQKCLIFFHFKHLRSVVRYRTTGETVASCMQSMIKKTVVPKTLSKIIIHYQQWSRVSESIGIGSLQARDYARIFVSRIVGAYARFIRENHRADNSIFNNAIFNNSIFNNLSQ